MAVKSIFKIKRFKDIKFWVEQSVLHLKCIEIRKHFLKNHSPRVPAKALACICVNIFCTLYVSGLLAQGGGRDVPQPENPGPKPIKCFFYRKEMNDRNEIL